MAFMGKKRFLVCGAAAISLMAATPAFAQQRTFDVPAQSANKAIPEFARQAGVQIIAPGSVLRGKRTKRIKGNLDVRAALKQLLEGTNLRIVSDDGTTITLARVAPSADAQAASTSETQPSLGESVAGSAAAHNESAEIVVTGSKIRGVQSLAAPSMTISRKDIERAPYSSTEDIFRSLPQNLSEISFDGSLGAGSSRLSSSNVEGASGISLRGLGPEATLVLVDGQRRPGNITGRVVDISAIPLAMIEDVEIVTGGRSAIYGSDAVAGVVNINLRKDFRGAETQTYYGSADDGGERFQFDQLLGIGDATKGVTVAYDYLHTSPLDLRKTGVIQPSPSGIVPDEFDIIPAQRRHSVFLSGHWRLTSNLDIYGDGLYTHQSTTTITDYSIPPLVSLQSSKYIGSEQFSGSVGAKLNVGAGWTANLVGTTGAVNNHEVFSSTLAIGTSTIPSDDASDNRSVLSQATFTMDGPLLTIGRGKVKAAFGGEYRFESYRDQSPITDVVTVGNKRHVGSLFGEIDVPLMTNEENVSAVELSAAGRLDDYNDFGRTFNPQFGIVVRPVPGLLLRSAYSSAFRAPSLFELAFGNQALIQNVTDASTGGPVTVVSWLGGNPELQPEKAKTWSAGFEYSPRFAPKLKISASYFNISYHGRIDQPADSASIAFVDPSLFSAIIDRSPTRDQLADVIASARNGIVNLSGATFDPTTQNLLDVFPNIILFDNRRNNVASDKISGLDFSAENSISFLDGELVSGINGTYYFSSKRRATDNSPSFDQLNRTGRPVDLRVRGNIGWTRGALGLFGFLNYVDNYTDTLSLPVRDVKSWLTMDLSLQFRGAEINTTSLANRINISLDIQNVFDRVPPVLMSNSFGLGYDPANANPFGRVIGARVRFKW